MLWRERQINCHATARVPTTFTQILILVLYSCLTGLLDHSLQAHYLFCLWGRYTGVSAQMLNKATDTTKSSAISDIWVFFFQTLSLISREVNYFGIGDQFASLINIEPSNAFGECTANMGVFGQFFFKVAVVPLYLFCATTLLGRVYNEVQETNPGNRKTNM